MKDKLINFFSSYKAAILLMTIYAVIMSAATFVEKEHGTDVAKALVYYSPLFILLHILMVLNFIFITVRRKLFRLHKWGYVTVHMALIVIITGAMVTHIFSEDGMLHLREGYSNNTIVIKNGDSYIEKELPFEVKLLDFKLTRYPGSNSPSSYESLLRLNIDGKSSDELVYMNHILDLKGYRFYQASYDPDEMGSILSVSYDVAGRRITYTGYFLLFIGLLGCLFSRGSRFRILYARLKSLKCIVLLLCLTGMSLQTYAIDIPEEHAEKFGNLPMQDRHGRMVPINTFASEIVRKLKLKEVVKGISDDQILLNIITDAPTWANKPIIIVYDAAVVEKYTNSKDVISYSDAFDEKGNYIYAYAVESIYQKNPAERSHTDKDLLKLDEKINLLHQLFNYKLLKIFPVPNDTIRHHWIAAGDEHKGLTGKESLEINKLFNNYRNEVLKASVSGKWQLADKAIDDITAYQEANKNGIVINKDKISAEYTYNRMNILSVCKRIYFISGGILLLLSFFYWFRKKDNKVLKAVKIILITAVIFGLAFHTYDMALRGYISGHVPWSNAYETMVLLSWSSVLGGLLFARRSFTAFALAVLLGGITLFVSGLNWMDPEITPLVPVLKSPWLMLHVATLMAAYGFMGLSCMIATTNLTAKAFINKNNRTRIEDGITKLTIINELSLIIGVVLMTIGIFLGAIWANESWGRYWSWDPKETWALITTIVYAIVLHLRWFEKKRNDLRFNFLSQWALLSVLMTYFGVNYLLSGMHSYGNKNGLADLPIIVIIATVILFIVPGSLAYISNKKLKRNYK